MTGFGKDFGVRIPEITVTFAVFVGVRQLVVKLLTGLGATISKGVSHDLSGTTT